MNRNMQHEYNVSIQMELNQLAKTTRSIIMNYSHLESQKMESTLFTITPAYNKQYCTDNLQTNWVPTSEYNPDLNYDYFLRIQS